MPDNQTGEKTEEPTPKRKEEAREEGKVAKSQELGQAFTLLGSFLILYILFQGMMGSLTDKITRQLSLTGVPALTPAHVYELLMDMIYFIVGLVGPVMLAAAAVGALINFIQVGPLFTVKSMQPKLDNLNPVSGLKNIFSLKTLMELLKSLFKVSAIALIAYKYISDFLPTLVTMPDQGLRPSLVLLGGLIARIGIAVIIFLVVLGVADYLYQRWEHKKSLKMTKYEVKQERKEREGDPEIKQKRKEKQRQMSLNRMMAEMEDADVVVTNPIHIAVALKYDLETMEAPVVVAKGEGFIARKIKEKARELEIEIVENKSLAQALNQMTEIGQEIPADLYQAVAEILAYLYRQENSS